MAVGYRKQITRLMTFLGGIYFVAEFLLPKSVLVAINADDLNEPITMGSICVGTMAFGLGIINLFYVHGSKILLRRKGWFESAVLLVGLIAMTTFTIADWRLSRLGAERSASMSLLGEFAQVIIKDEAAHTPGVLQPRERIERLIAAFEHERFNFDSRIPMLGVTARAGKMEEAVSLFDRSRTLLTVASGETVSSFPTDSLNAFTKGAGDLSTIIGDLERSAAEATVVRHLYQTLFDGIFVSLGSAMFALLGVYIAAAAYRAFRVRSFEASLMMAAALIVMLGQIPQGTQLYSGLPEWRLWLLEVPNSAVFRAIKIGAEVAALVMAFRMWLSIESDRFSGGAE